MSVPVLLLSLLAAARALSTCRTLDLEAARLKRIEAVRGQILSKLRLPEAPAEPGPARPLPDDVRALYNSTRELLRQRERRREPEDPQDYWAKELLRFPMESPGDGVPERWRPTPRSLYFVFNASRVRAGLGRAELSRAELRLLRQGTAAGTAGTAAGTAGTAAETEQRVELYQGFGNSSWRYLQGRSVRVTAEDEWLWFDVTDTVLQWLRGSEALGVFRLSVHCPCEPGGHGDGPTLKISVEGFEQQRGDMQSIARRHRRVPHVLAMALPPERAQALHGHRQRRALEGQHCGGGAELLCPSSLDRFPPGPAVEVDPRAAGLHGQLLRGAVPLHLELRHPLQQGAGPVQPAQPRGVGGAVLRPPEPGAPSHHLLRGEKSPGGAALGDGGQRLQVQLTPPRRIPKTAAKNSCLRRRKFPENFQVLLPINVI